MKIVTAVKDFPFGTELWQNVLFVMYLCPENNYNCQHLLVHVVLLLIDTPGTSSPCFS